VGVLDQGVWEGEFFFLETPDDVDYALTHDK
jgi:hypothetical protein